MSARAVSIAPRQVFKGEGGLHELAPDLSKTWTLQQLRDAWEGQYQLEPGVWVTGITISSAVDGSIQRKIQGTDGITQLEWSAVGPDRFVISSIDHTVGAFETLARTMNETATITTTTITALENLTAFIPPDFVIDSTYDVTSWGDQWAQTIGTSMKRRMSRKTGSAVPGMNHAAEMFIKATSIQELRAARENLIKDGLKIEGTIATLYSARKTQLTNEYRHRES